MSIKRLQDHLILFFKAQQHALFAAPVTVQGHTRANGIFVAPYTSRRKKRMTPSKTPDLFGAGQLQHPARTVATAVQPPDPPLPPAGNPVELPKARPSLLTSPAPLGGSGGGKDSNGGNGGNGGEPPDKKREAQRQYDAVVARYTLPDGTKAPGWMKAPNGKPTKLNERQWVQVRTENFKNWFGDWEFAAHQQAIDELQTVPIDFMLDNTLPLAEARHQALAETKRKFSLDQQPKIVTAPNGDEIQIAMAGLKESISKHAGLQKMRILPALDRLIENSHFVLAAPDAKADQRKTPNILGYRYYVAKAELDGKPYYVKLAVREIEDGGIKRKFYDHDLSEVSEVIREQGTAHLAAAGNPTAMTSLDHIVRHGWQKFNGDVSQVIDDNGEPRVAYHQTTVDITEFVPGGEPVKQYGEQVHLRGSKAGKFNYYGIEGMVSGPGIWFADNPNETNAGPQANVISATSNPNLIPGFMALKNPLLITSNEQRMALRDRYKPDPHNLPVDSKVKDHNGRTWFVKHTDLDFPFRFDQRQKKQLIRDGYDGIVLAISGWAREYIAFSPTQIKSALGNTGGFDGKDAHINKAWPFPPDVRFLFFAAKSPKGHRYAPAI